MIEFLQAAQRTDGSLGGAAEPSWLALGAFETSNDDSARAAARRAWAFVEPATSRSTVHDPATSNASNEVRRARDFLRTARAATDSAALDPAERELFTLAGGPFDVRQAYALATESSGAANSAPAELADSLLSAAVLDHYRSSKESTLLADMARPSESFERALELRWSSDVGAWTDSSTKTPSVRATSYGLLLADIVERWKHAREQVARGSRSGYTSPDEARASCESCHEGLHPSLVAQWRDSRHEREGVDCASCHGENHSKIFRESGRVSVEVCGDCHAARVAEFATSRHARAETTLLASPLFAATPAAERATCMACHRIGERGTGEAPGNCNYCHPGHAFSSAQAREPEACTVCHTGADYPQDEAYRLSKHGALHATTRDEHTAPTCATCHQPGGRHDDGFGITIGGVGVGAALAGTPTPFPMPEISASEFSEHRAAMVAVCARCHSSRMAEQSLREADELKRAGEALLREGATLLNDLHARGLVGEGAGATLTLGPEQVRPHPSSPGAAALSRYYDMWRFHFATSWKGAYHQSPSIANQRSRPGLGEELELLRAEVDRLRSIGDQR